MQDGVGSRREVVDDDRRRPLLLRLRLDLRGAQRRERPCGRDAGRPVGLAARLRGEERAAQDLDGPGVAGNAFASYGVSAQMVVVLGGALGCAVVADGRVVGVGFSLFGLLDPDGQDVIASGAATSP